MSLCAIIDAMIASGCSPEQIGAAVRAHEADAVRKAEKEADKAAEKAEARKAAAADRQAQFRDREATKRELRNAAFGVTERDDALSERDEHHKVRADASEPERAFVSNQEFSLPPSPPKGGSVPPRGPAGKSSRGHRLPEEWQPTEVTIEAGLRVGHSREHVLGDGLDEFRDYWRGIPGVRGTRTDWDGTYRNRLRATAPRGPRARAGPPSQVDNIEAVRRRMRQGNGTDHDDEDEGGTGGTEPGDVGPRHDVHESDRGRRAPLLDLVAVRSH